MSEEVKPKNKGGRPRKHWDLEEVIAKLPVAATIQEDLNWVHSHPAMRRKSLDASGKAVVITPDDVLNPPHGPAPSQSAVNMLHHWANHPAVFYQQMISEHKKKTSTSVGGAAEIEIRNLRHFMEKIKSAVKPKEE